jgi:hypothetical protein
MAVDQKPRTVREAVGVFKGADTLQVAIDELLVEVSLPLSRRNKINRRPDVVARSLSRCAA